MYSINAFTQTYWHGNQGMKIVQCCLVQCDITSTLDMTLLPPSQYFMSVIAQASTFYSPTNTTGP